MSVINKMLRDLDQRQDAHAPVANGGAPSAAALRQGTATITFGKPAARQHAERRLWVWLGVGALLVATLSAGAWLWLQNEKTTSRVDGAGTAPPAQSSPSAPAAAPPSVAASAVIAASAPADPPAQPGPDASPAPAAALDGVSSASGTSASAMTLRMESSLSARKALDALLSTPAPVATATPAPTVASTERPKARTAAAPAAATPTSAGENAVPAIQRQQQAGGDAIAQAQILWNSGSHDAAIELMQQSIAAAERSAKTGATSGANNTVLAPLVREMARMQLAEARFGAVWEMLTRLEPLLGGQADLWAIRANAAQRLGRHQDSVHAYMMALQSRPDEQRWLLGTAVSLAALGQTTSAGEMAEKARAIGPVGKDILAYLRQTGVPLRDQ